MGENLSRQAELNNIMDALATKAKKSLLWSKQYSQPPAYPANKIGIVINNKMITRNLNCKIQQEYTSINIWNHIETKFKWNAKVADLFNWEIYGSNLLCIGYYKHHFVVKFIHERLPFLRELFSASATQ
eukprot:9556513-Ditylum_brightwellii.AAC.1